MVMTTLEILRKAREHISDPGMWFKGAYTAQGWNGIFNGSPCCAEGAIFWAAGRYEIEPTHDVIRAVSDACGREVPSFNDDPNTTHADVLAAFDRAIAAEEARHG